MIDPTPDEIADALRNHVDPPHAESLGARIEALLDDAAREARRNARGGLASVEQLAELYERTRDEVRESGHALDNITECVVALAAAYLSREVPS